MTILGAFAGWELLLPPLQKEIVAQNVNQIVDEIYYGPRHKFRSFSVVQDRKGNIKANRTIQRKGFVRMRIDGEIYNLEEDEIV